MKTMDVRNSSKEPGGFWEAYRACAEENRIRLDRSRTFREMLRIIWRRPLRK